MADASDDSGSDHFEIDDGAAMEQLADSLSSSGGVHNSFVPRCSMPRRICSDPGVDRDKSCLLGNYL